MTIIELRVDPEFESKIPPLTEDEYRQLEENILSEGAVLMPLIVWKGTIVDGHNRYKILREKPCLMVRSISSAAWETYCRIPRLPTLSGTVIVLALEIFRPSGR